jgi:5-formyltetrahydrofolate cyclo-ligase
VFCTKDELRSVFSEKRRGLSFDEREKADSVLFSRVVSLKEFTDAETILCYYPVKNEINVLPIALYALSCGKRVAFPISDKKNHTLSFHIVNAVDDMVMGAYSIPEPSENAAPAENNDKCLCLVPGLVYDKKGYRVGYGKGFYDRFLADCNYKGISVGRCYTDFLIEEIPKDKNDIPVDILISDKEELCFYERKK